MEVDRNSKKYNEEQSQATLISVSSVSLQNMSFISLWFGWWSVCWEEYVEHISL